MTSQTSPIIMAAYRPDMYRRSLNTTMNRLDKGGLTFVLAGTVVVLTGAFGPTFHADPFLLPVLELFIVEGVSIIASVLGFKLNHTLIKPAAARVVSDMGSTVELLLSAGFLTFLFG